MKQAALQLARYYVAGPMDVESLYRNGSRAVTNLKKARWFKPVTIFVARAFQEDSVRPTRREVAGVIMLCPAFYRSYDRGKIDLVSYNDPVPAQMVPARGAAESWAVPPVTTRGDLARVLSLHIDDLGWLTMPSCRKEHYHLLWHEKKGVPESRLIEVPKPLLKGTQREILSRIVGKIPVHDSVCGFEKGRSIFDFVAPHCHRDLVVKMDFKAFFPSIGSGAVFRLFMAAGYPESIAGLLCRLCTHSVSIGFTSRSNLEKVARDQLARTHLPQGAPTSPALANRIAYRFDCRVAGLARSAGLNYTRYADDLLFSGMRNRRLSVSRLTETVEKIARESGFQIHPDKTRIMTASQSQTACGVVMNERPNLKRREFEQLKAILNNCVRHGWQSQNRDEHPDFRAHLEGRLNWACQVNSLKAQKLQKLFDQIRWV
ncbi:MAG: reverse transcriptase family protein [Verrucomicrobiales bacterium]|nr:reverse transcriptase family protein [Verrucomicrobiales bacterium]